MAPPILKKQKIDNSMPPIVFSTPGLKPDTRLTVFEQEFQVHSLVLKLHSAFFRKFLDSPDKAPNNGIAGPANGSANTNTSSSTNAGTAIAAAANSAPSTLSKPSSTDFTSFGTFGVASIGQPFKYDWITKIDEEGKWHLVCRSSKNKPYKIPSFAGDTDQETAEFEKLLCAIYNRSYSIANVDEFLSLVEMADYYCALPSLSQTLYSSMLRSPSFVGEIRHRSLDLFVAAAKVRNALLFREALIWIVGPYNDPEFQQLEDRSLRSIAKSVHGELSTRVLDMYDAGASKNDLEGHFLCATIEDQDLP
ncbi:hypothetical protein DL95DRAFT_461401 [Leptodontidium sp. 2 PMI_412]|nr:hypothetical protein DL95DRAFT_461401 [Leptodontidium sp. 2 PMI_412]